MKFVYVALLSVALLLSGVSSVGNAAGLDLVRTEQLLELCGTSPDDADYVAAVAFCMGYIDAALDYHAALTGTGRSAAITCPRGKEEKGSA